MLLGNGFVNTEDKTIYINKKDLNKAFNYEIVEVEYKKDYQKNLYYGKIINYTLVGKILTGFVHHIYKNEIWSFIRAQHIFIIVYSTNVI